MIFLPDALKFLICIDEMRVWCVKSPTMTSVRKTLRVHEIKKEAGMKVFGQDMEAGSGRRACGCAGSIAGVFWKSGQYGEPVLRASYVIRRAR